MTSVPGCCCDPQISTGVVIAGSGSPHPVAINQPNLSLYLARVDDSCIPCQSGMIHGTVNVQVMTIFQTTSTSVNQPFEIPYGIGTQGLEYFPDTPIIEDPKKKGVWKLDPDNPSSYNEKFKLFDRLSFNTIKQLIDQIKTKDKFLYKGVPFQICDCYTDALYTSSTKTDDENDRAKIQQLLCSLWKVGINALHLKWKPSLYLGEHDTTVGPVAPSSVAGMSSTMLFKAAETNYFEEWEDRWQTTQHARTILLPKSLKKSDIKKPISINWMKLKKGSMEDVFNRNTVDPRDYPAPNINGNPHENSYTLKTADWRIAFSAAVWGSLYSTNYRNNPERYSYGSVDGSDLSERLEQINVLYKSGGPEYYPLVQGITLPVPSTGNVSSATTIAGHGCEQTTTKCDGSTGSTAIPAGWVFTFPNDTKFTYLYPNNTAFFGAKDGDLSKSQSNKSLLYYTIKQPQTNPCYEKQEVIKPGILTTTPCGVDSSGCCSSVTYKYTPGFPGGIRVCVDTNANYKLAVIGFYLENNPQYINSIFLDGPEVAFSHKILSNKYYPDTPPADPCKAKPNETTYTTADYGHTESTTKPKFWWATNQGTQQLNDLRSTGGVIYRIKLSKLYHQGKKLTQVPYINPIAISTTNNCKKYFGCIDKYTCKVTITIATTNCCEASSWSYSYYDPKACSCSEPSKTTTSTGCAWDSDCDEECCTTYTETIERIAWCDAFPDDSCCVPDEIIYDECGKPIDPCGESIPKVDKKEQDTTEKVLNPFLMFDKQHQTYGNLLARLAPNAWRVVKNDQDDSSNVDDSSYEFCKDGGRIDPDCGITVHTFNTTEYLQSMVTSLYGKKLEYGNLKLKTVDNLPTSTSSVVMFETRKDDWPQAIAPISFNSSPPEVKERTGESNKTEMIERLKARTDKYPGQGANANRYWYYRTVYELADIFAIKPIPTEGDDEFVKIDEKAVYYPAGIPNLEYSETKLQITSDGKIKFKTVDRYKLNWFDVPIESLLVP